MESLQVYPTAQLSLPDWIPDEVGDPTRAYPSLEDRMDLILRLAIRNIRSGGGPFAAGVFEMETGRLVAPGVNRVVPLACSLAHAEALAVATAQAVHGSHDLGQPGLPPMELVTSAQPCIQCFGILWWSGLRRLVVGATKEDVESLAGFEEGPLPDSWASRLAKRSPLPPITVVRGILRERARGVLAQYREQGGTIYNPSHSGS
jgi:tRNA(Arg) A34 adenosine deaminase TadA